MRAAFWRCSSRRLLAFFAAATVHRSFAVDRRWRLGTAAAVRAVAELGAGRALADRLERDHALVLADVHHLHALRVAPGLADALHRRADGLTAVGDQHDLVFRLDQRDADDRSVALAGVDQD